jgi:hypothetical protein
MDTTLTKERLIAASPLPADRRLQLEWICAFSTDPGFAYRIVYEAWEYLYTWYAFEATEIGEKRAFWGVVYRLR